MREYFCLMTEKGTVFHFEVLEYNKKDRDYADFLKLIEMPDIEEKDGKVYMTGMTYSDVDVLLAYYRLVLEQTVFKHGPFGY